MWIKAGLKKGGELVGMGKVCDTIFRMSGHNKRKVLRPSVTLSGLLLTLMHKLFAQVN